MIMENSTIDLNVQTSYYFNQNLKRIFEQNIDSLICHKLDLGDFGNALGNVLKNKCVKGIFGHNFEDFFCGLVHGLDLYKYDIHDQAKLDMLHTVSFDFIKNVQEVIFDK